MFKKLLTIAFFGFGVLIAKATSFSDDFESYTVGEYLGEASINWTTWSGVTGGAEDVQVTDSKAHSGTKAIYLSSANTNGGPEDLILDFGGEYNTGQFNFSTWIFVEENHSAYFNFQADSVVGESWSLELTLEEDGNFKITSDVTSTINAEFTYPQEEWFEFEMKVNLNTSTWEIFLNGDSVTTFQNQIYQLSSMDIYPIQGSSFWIDDISYEHNPYTFSTLNAGVIFIEASGALEGQTVNSSVKVRNLGNSEINSLDVSLEYEGTLLSESLSGISLQSNEVYEIDFADQLVLQGGEHPVMATIINVNSALDDDVSDNTKTIYIDATVPAPGKKVVFEDVQSGPICGFCPAGDVFLSDLAERYSDFFIPISVHTYDGMAYPEYDDLIGFNSYPSMTSERTEIFVYDVYNITDVENRFLERVVVPTPATVHSAAEYNEQTDSLWITGQANFIESISGNYRLAVVLTEDSVTGTTSDYNQENFFAGGQYGDMGGYGSLPDPVPASQMVYNRVARKLIGNFHGEPNSLPLDMEQGETYAHTFGAVYLSPEYDMNHINVITLLIGPDSTIVNGNSTTLAEAMSGTVGITKNITKNEVTIFPNPSQESAFIRINLKERKQINIHLYNAMGTLVDTRSYGALVGDQLLPISRANLVDGLYFINVQMDGDFVTKTIQFID